MDPGHDEPERATDHGDGSLSIEGPRGNETRWRYEEQSKSNHRAKRTGCLIGSLTINRFN
jgi:hypothetical protein